MEIYLISRRMANHAGPAGYDRLAEFVGGKTLQPIEKWKFHQRIVARIFRGVIEGSNLQWYHRDSFCQELSAARRWLGGPKKVFHFLYGENSYRYLGLMKKFAGHKIVCTYHTPPDKFKKVVRAGEHLDRIDRAVVVSRSQVAFFSGMIGPEKVVYVPHGIDTRYFIPVGRSREPSERIRCLFVGTHLRDFRTLAEAARCMNRRGISFSLNVVTAPGFHSFFETVENVNCLSHVSDDLLLQLYRESDVLLFPLLGSTANNTLLEAMACGLPVITTRMDGVRDYVTEECSVLTPKEDAAALAEAVSMVKQTPGLLAGMARAGRERALRFSWPRIAEKMEKLYASL